MTQRVPGATVVHSTPWLELHELNGYVFSHSPKWKGVAVAILPYRTSPAPGGQKLEFLAVMESRPAHGGGEYISSITGAYDNADKYSLEQCALNELEEEGGYHAWKKEVVSLGWVNGSKSSDGIDHLFAVEITPDDEQVESKGDGSAGETNLRPVWITGAQVINSKDMILITMYCRLLHLSSLIKE